MKRLLGHGAAADLDAAILERVAATRPRHLYDALVSLHSRRVAWAILYHAAEQLRLERRIRTYGGRWYVVRGRV